MRCESLVLISTSSTWSASGDRQRPTIPFSEPRGSNPSNECGSPVSPDRHAAISLVLMIMKNLRRITALESKWKIK